MLRKFYALCSSQLSTLQGVPLCWFILNCSVRTILLGINHDKPTWISERHFGLWRQHLLHQRDENSKLKVSMPCFPLGSWLCGQGSFHTSSWQFSRGGDFFGTNNDGTHMSNTTPILPQGPPIVPGKLLGRCHHSWLVVGPPLWKIWVRQLGWLDIPNIKWENKSHGNQLPPTRVGIPELFHGQNVQLTGDRLPRYDRGMIYWGGIHPVGPVDQSSPVRHLCEKNIPGESWFIWFWYHTTHGKNMKKPTSMVGLWWFTIPK